VKEVSVLGRSVNAKFDSDPRIKRLN
jgi:hypothetical protein